MFPRFCPWRNPAEQDITHALTNFPHRIRGFINTLAPEWER